jgi:preprotein translocase subunit SecY
MDLFKQMAAALNYGTVLYDVLYALMILFFSYFWVATAIQSRPDCRRFEEVWRVCPGHPPRRPTADFLDKTMTRITLAGAFF